MAKIVPDEDAWGPKTPRGKVMDWSRYCDGRSWRLERGVDVDPEKSMHSKRSSFRQWAARQGLDMAYVHTSVEDDSLLYIKVDSEAWPEGMNPPPVVEAEMAFRVPPPPTRTQRAQQLGARSRVDEIRERA